MTRAKNSTRFSLLALVKSWSRVRTFELYEPDTICKTTYLLTIHIRYGMNVK